MSRRLSPGVVGSGGSSPSSDSDSDAPSNSERRTPYTSQDLLVDLTPVAACLIVHASLWSRGYAWLVCLVLAIQVAGATWVFRSLRKQVVASPSSRPPAPPVASWASAEEKTDPVRKSSLRSRRQRLPGFDLVANAPVNPFLHPAWLLQSQWERLRISVMSVTLVPVRLVSFVIIILGVWAMLQALLIGVSMDDRMKRPLPAWRSRAIHLLVPLCARAVMFFSFGFFWLDEIGVEHRTRSPAVAPIVVSNHVSFTDPILLYSRYFMSAVGAIDNLSLPIIGAICSAVQTITVDRKDDKSRHTVIDTIVTRARWTSLTAEERDAKCGPGSSSGSWPQILIFPEATTTNGQALINFKPGAFVAKVPVQPVLIRYSADRYPGGRFHPSWVSAGPSQGMMLLRFWSEPINHVVIEYMPPMAPIETETAESTSSSNSTGTANSTAAADSVGTVTADSPPRTDSVGQFSHRVRKAMADRLGVPVTEHTYLDVVLQDLALAKTRKRRAKNDAKNDAAKSDANSTAAAAAATAAGTNDQQVPPRSVTPIPPTPATPAHARPILTSVLELSSLQRVFKCDLDTITRHVEKFRLMDRSRSGLVTYPEFLAFFNIDADADRAEGDASSMRQLFNLLDEDESGTLDVREFLLGLALVSDVRDDPDDATLRLAFAMFDLDGDDQLEVAHLERVFRRAFPTIGDAEVRAAFRDVTQATTPRGSTRNTDKVSYEQFVEFCLSHPECVEKFKQTLFTA